MPSEPPPATTVRSGKLGELFGIDRRSLAAFRIGLGILLLWDLYGRAQTLREHYTAEGAFPAELAAALGPNRLPFRLFLLSDRFEVQAALFVLFALVALLLLLGWRTRVVSVLSFLLLCSLVKRNPFVCHTGDVLLKALSFWAMFLPLGACFSLDRLRGRGRDEGRALSFGTAGMLLQVALFYVCAGLLKARYAVWREGEAVWVFTHVIEYVRPFGAWLGQFPLACRGLTFATLVLEGVAPWFLFAPFGTRRIRMLLFPVFLAFHLTLQATIHIGIFQLTCIAMWFLFLPGEFWDGLGRRVPAGIAARWRALDAALRARLGREPGLAAGAPGGLSRAGARAVHVFLALAAAVILLSNVNSLVRDPYDPEDRELIALQDDGGGAGLRLARGVVQTVDDYGRQMSLVQSWNMFTDIDRLYFGWFLVLGQQEDGALVDVLEQAPFREIRVPEDYARLFPNHNSRRYWRNVAKYGELIVPMCEYLAREWTRAGRPALVHLAIFHIGRIPSQNARRDQVKRVIDQWEAAHEPLRTAAPEVQQRWAQWRASWQAFLDGLPKTVPAAR